MKEQIKKLGDAINETLSNSDRIAEAIEAIKSQGYDVFLVLEATVGFNKRDSDDEGITEIGADDETEPELRVSAQDVRFLKQLKISVDQSEAA